MENFCCEKKQTKQILLIFFPFPSSIHEYISKKEAFVEWSFSQICGTYERTRAMNLFSTSPFFSSFPFSPLFFFGGLPFSAIDVHSPFGCISHFTVEHPSAQHRGILYFTVYFSILIKIIKKFNHVPCGMYVVWLPALFLSSPPYIFPKRPPFLSSENKNRLCSKGLRLDLTTFEWLTKFWYLGKVAFAKEDIFKTNLRQKECPDKKQKIERTVQIMLGGSGQIWIFLFRFGGQMGQKLKKNLKTVKSFLTNFGKYSGYQKLQFGILFYLTNI